MGFQCKKCGACCKLVKKLIGNTPFPYSFTEDGTCEKYDPVIGCTVYETRPDVCNIEAGYEVYNRILPMGKETYYELTKINCNRWMDQLNIDKSFKY